MKKIKLAAAALSEFRTYIYVCLNSSCIQESSTLNNLVMFHLKALEHKAEIKNLDIRLKGRKSVILNLNFAEQTTLSFMFKRVPVSDFLRPIEFNIIGEL